MRILLDENMPESARIALRQLGHEVDSVVSLRLQGLDNGQLHREVAQSYHLCFTRDRRFVETVRSLDRPGPVKIIRVTIPQAPGPGFTGAFIEAFRRTDWADWPNGSEWPAHP